MGTNVEYNGIALHNVQTRQWDQEMGYDESDTDNVYQKFHLRFEGILHLEHVYGYDEAQTAPAFIAPSDGPFGAGDIGIAYQTVKAKLESPRGYLKITMNNVVMLECKSSAILALAEDMDTDRDNGPKPRHVAITHVAGDKLLRIDFSIDCVKGLPCNTNAANPRVLNNRWSIGEAIDDNWFTTRTIRGRMRQSSSLYAANFSRYVVVPPLEKGFRRLSMEFIVSPNMLEVDYVIVDRQVHDAAPWPATKIGGTFSTSTEDGLIFSSALHLRLDGPPNANKKMMLVRALQIAQLKMEMIVPGNDPQNVQGVGYLVQQASIVEYIGDVNAIEVHLAIQHNKPNPREWLNNLYVKKFGEPLELGAVNGEPAPYDPGVSREPELFGYTPYSEDARSPAVLFMLECYQQSPCGEHRLSFQGSLTPPEQNNTSPGELPQTSGYQSPVNLPPSEGDYYSPDTRECFYTTCRAERKYHALPSRIQLPLTASPSVSPGSPGELASRTCVVAEVGLTLCRCQIHVDYERVGKWPEVPPPNDSYTDGNIQGKLLEHWIRPQPPTLSADGRMPVYRLSAFYSYALDRPPDSRDQYLRVGVLPFTNFTQENTQLKLTDVYKDQT